MRSEACTAVDTKQSVAAVIRIGESSNVPGCRCIAALNIVPREQLHGPRDVEERVDWHGTYDEPRGPVFILVQQTVAEMRSEWYSGRF